MKLYLHIGQQKTGSTSLQRFLKRNYLPLLEYKILYSKVFGANKQKLITEIIDAEAEEVLKKKEEIVKEVNESGSKVVIFSEENLFNLPLEKIERLRKFVSSVFDEVIVICYLRVQYDHFVSSYQQNIRGKKYMDLDEFISEKLDESYYNYNLVISKWAAAFPGAQFVIKNYKRMEQNDIRLDFCKILDVNSSKFDFSENKLDKNLSIDAASLALIKRLNFVEHELGQGLAHDIKRNLRVGLKSSSSNQKLTLTNIQRNTIFDHFLANNKELEETYFNASSDFTTAPPKVTEDFTFELESLEFSIDKMLTVLGYIN